MQGRAVAPSFGCSRLQLRVQVPLPIVNRNRIVDKIEDRIVVRGVHSIDMMAD